MASWWSKFRSAPPPFRWTPELRSSFFAQFRDDPTHGRPVFSPTVVLSQSHLSIHSRDLDEERVLLGWKPPFGLNRQMQEVGFLPVKILLQTSSDQFARREARSWSELKPLGDWYLSDRVHDDSAHGFEVALYLDAQRMTQLLATVRETAPGIAPVFTFGLNLAVDSIADARAQVMAYRISTWPMRIVSGMKHPWVGDLG